MKLIEDGKDAPPQFYERPDIKPDHLFYWTAFHDLSSDRALGNSLGPIPYSAIRRYADEFDITSRDEFDYFLGILQAMDNEYLTIVNAPKSGDEKMIPISDIEEQHLMFDRMRARAKAATKKHKK